jgi:hypothetical protein
MREKDMKKSIKKNNGDMRREYDFSNGERGKFFRLSESQRMIPLDADIIQYFQRRSRKEKKAYYILINETLRRAMNYEKAGEGFSELLREMIAEEVQRYAIQK